MKKNEQLKNKARELRSMGLSYNEIAVQLDRPKSTITSWVSDIKLSDEQLTCLKNKSVVNLTYNGGGVPGRQTDRRKEMGEEVWTEYQEKRQKKKHLDLIKDPKRYAKRKIKIQLAGIDYKRNLKKEYIAYKGGKCENCGYNKDCLSAYHFHHKDPIEKEFCISRSRRKNQAETVYKELDKCQLLCSNCHAEAHDILYIQQKEETMKRLKMMLNSED